MRRPNRSLTWTIAMVALSVLAAPIGESAPIRGPACLHVPFQGITETSETGEVIGSSDPRDWGCTSEKGGIGSVSARGTATPPPAPPPPEGVCTFPAAPNPATHSLVLRFTLGETRQVRLLIYGQEWRHGPREVFTVRTLIEAQLQAGHHTVTWDRRNDAGEIVPAGMYRAVLEAGTDVLCGDIELR